MTRVSRHCWGQLLDEGALAAEGPGWRQTTISDLDVKKIRAATQLSQARFAELLSIEIGTLRNWEQGRREPTGPAKALLRAIRNDPVSVLKALRTD
jgi:putative transcriptional regulator